MISEKLLSIVGETEKLDELKALMDEIDAVEAENTTLTANAEELENHIKELNEVNANLLISSVGKAVEEEKEETSIEDMDEEEFLAYLDDKVNA